jgi:hypothetical protein
MARPNDNSVGKKIGGVNVFGGGLALDNVEHQVIGAVGVSGETSCAKHMIGSRVHNNLGLEHRSGIGGVSVDSTRPDNIVYDITPNSSGGTGVSADSFGHPTRFRPSLRPKLVDRSMNCTAHCLVRSNFFRVLDTLVRGP